MFVAENKLTCAKKVNLHFTDFMEETLRYIAEAKVRSCVQWCNFTANNPSKYPKLTIQNDSLFMLGSFRQWAPTRSHRHKCGLVAEKGIDSNN
jgi:hypothetical protein